MIIHVINKKCVLFSEQQIGHPTYLPTEEELVNEIEHQKTLLNLHKLEH